MIKNVLNWWVITVVGLLALLNPTTGSAQENHPGNITDTDFDRLLVQAIEHHRGHTGEKFTYQEIDRIVGDEAIIVYVERKALDTETVLPGKVDIIIALRESESWNILFPGDQNYQRAFNDLSSEVAEQIDISAFEALGSPEVTADLVLTDYRLPWTHSHWATVTRSFNVHGTGQIDFVIDAGNKNVVAAKSGTIIYVNDSHTINTYSSGAWWYWNTVVIRHDTNEFTTYAHLSYNSVPTWIKSQCSSDYGSQNCAVPISAGQVIGVEGNTGVSSASHLHLTGGQIFIVDTTHTDTQDEDGDGNRSEIVPTGYGWNLHNFAFVGYTIAEVASWPNGYRLQAVHNTPPTPTPTPTPTDTTPPTTSILLAGTVGTNGWYTSNVQVTLSANEPTNWTRYRLNGGGWQTYSVPLTVSSQGRTTLEYYSQDVRGNTEAIKSTPINLDRTPPSVTNFVINEGAATSYNRTALLTSNASDSHSGLAQMCASYNQLEWECQSYQAEAPFALPLADQETVIVYFYVTDQAGHRSALTSDSIVLDLYPPMPHSAAYRICQDTFSAAGRQGLSSSRYNVTSTLGQPIVGQNGASSHYRLLSGFLTNQVGCLPIERTTFGYKLVQSILAAGGNVRVSGRYRVGDTIGEPVVNPLTLTTVTMQGSNFQVTSGFWPNVPFGNPVPSATPTATLPPSGTVTATPGASPIPSATGTPASHNTPLYLPLVFD